MKKVRLLVTDINLIAKFAKTRNILHVPDTVWQEKTLYDKWDILKPLLPYITVKLQEDLQNIKVDITNIEKDLSHYTQLKRENEPTSYTLERYSPKLFGESVLQNDIYVKSVIFLNSVKEIKLLKETLTIRLLEQKNLTTLDNILNKIYNEKNH